MTKLKIPRTALLTLFVGALRIAICHSGTCIIIFYYFLVFGCWKFLSMLYFFQGYVFLFLLFSFWFIFPPTTKIVTCLLFCCKLFFFPSSSQRPLFCLLLIIIAFLFFLFFFFPSLFSADFLSFFV